MLPRGRFSLAEHAKMRYNKRKQGESHPFDYIRRNNMKRGISLLLMGVLLLCAACSSGKEA
ncbi:MAG: hypothetical protein J6X30_02455, partial [Clostridia bacterium]|nr:hypothetical protein [Clostridia bacterium]